MAKNVAKGTRRLEGPLTYSVAEAAGLIGVSEKVIYSSLKRGDFPVAVIRIGRTVRIMRDALEEFLTAA